MSAHASTRSRPLVTWTLTLTLTLASAAAWGGECPDRDDCAPGTRNARREYQAEHERAKLLTRLDCAGLEGLAESQRGMANARINARLFRAPNLTPIRSPTVISTTTPPTPAPDLKLDEPAKPSRVIEPKPPSEPVAPPAPPEATTRR